MRAKSAIWSRRAAGGPSGAASYKRAYWPYADSGGTGTGPECTQRTKSPQNATPVALLEKIRACNS